MILAGLMYDHVSGTCVTVNVQRVAPYERRLSEALMLGEVSKETSEQLAKVNRPRRALLRCAPSSTVSCSSDLLVRSSLRTSQRSRKTLGRAIWKSLMLSMRGDLARDETAASPIQ